MSGVVIRVKRSRSDEGMDELVVRIGRSELMETTAKLGRVDLNNNNNNNDDDNVGTAVGGTQRNRRFRRIGTVTLKESERVLLEDPGSIAKQQQQTVKEASQLSVDGMAQRGRDESQQNVKSNRLKLLQEKRLGIHRVLDVGLEDTRVGAKVNNGAG